jgi:hypothetical protein
MTPGCPQNPPHDIESAEPRLRTLRPSPHRATGAGCPRCGSTRRPRTAPAVRYRRHCRHQVPASRAPADQNQKAISALHTGGGANFERLRETKDLSAPWPTGAERKGRIRLKRRLRRTLHPAPLARPCYPPGTAVVGHYHAVARSHEDREHAVPFPPGLRKAVWKNDRALSFSRRDLMEAKTRFKLSHPVRYTKVG